MTDQTDPDGRTPDTVQELTGREDGIWNVITRDSIHQFDFTAGTVTRIPGPNARPGINDVPRPLQQISKCRVNQRGYWTMRSDLWVVDVYWQNCSVISRIERAVDPSSPRSVEPNPEGRA
jgi:hypothetical protein